MTAVTAWIILVFAQSLLWWPHWSPVRTFVVFALLLAMLIPMIKVKSMGVTDAG